MNRISPHIDNLLATYQSLEASLKILKGSLSRAQGQVYGQPLKRDGKKTGSEDRTGACMYMDSSTGGPTGDLFDLFENEFGSIRGDLPGEESLALSAKTIRVTPAGGTKAADLACAMYSQLRRRVAQPPRECDRLTGVIWTHDKDVFEHVRLVNRWKDMLKDSVANVSLTLGRKGNMRSGKILMSVPELRHVHLIQAYRHIPAHMRIVGEGSAATAVPLAVHKVSFGWSEFSRVIKRERADRYAFNVEGLSPVEISTWGDKIRKAPFGYVAVARDVAPMPLMYLEVDSDHPDLAHRREHPHMWTNKITASLPMIIFGYHAPTIIRPLENFQPTDRGEHRRSDSNLSDEPLIEQLNLYTYKSDPIAWSRARKAKRASTSESEMDDEVT